jgi:hypothetical protein
MKRIMVGAIGLSLVLTGNVWAQDAMTEQYHDMLRDSGSDMSLSGASSSDTASEGGVGCGPVRIHPSLSISVERDSNPNDASSHEKGATSINFTPALDAQIKGNNWDAILRGWYTYDWYLDQSSTEKKVLERQYYGEEFGLNFQSPRGTKLSLDEYYEFQQRNSEVWLSSGSGLYNAAWGDRQEFRLSAALNQPLGEKTGLNVGAGMTDYSFDIASLYGWTDYSASLGLSRQLSEKTDVVVDFGYDLQNSDNANSDSSSFNGMLGIQSRPSPKTSYKAEVGVMSYDYNNGEYNATSWKYNLSGNWIVIPQLLTASLSGSSSYQPSETDLNDFALVQTIQGGLSYQFTSRFSTDITGIYNREKYHAADYENNLVSAYARLNYALTKYAKFFIGADYTKNISSSDSLPYSYSYNREFVEAGVVLRY